jgi:uncharacterized lipoprotein YajG
MNKHLQTLVVILFALGLFVLSGCSKQKTTLDLDLDYTHENDEFVEEDL